MAFYEGGERENAGVGKPLVCIEKFCSLPANKEVESCRKRINLSKG